MFHFSILGDRISNAVTVMRSIVILLGRSQQVALNVLRSRIVGMFSCRIANAVFWMFEGFLYQF